MKSRENPYFLVGLRAVLGLILGASFVHIACAAPVDLSKNVAFSKPYGLVTFSSDTQVPEGKSYISGYAFAGELGWIDLGDGSPANGTSYSNLTPDDIGINVDSGGNLTGFAFNKTLGLISLDWPGAQPSQLPRLNFQSGEITGLWFNPNAGWFDFGETPPYDVPTLSEWGIILLVLGLGGFAFRRARHLTMATEY